MNVISEEAATSGSRLKGLTQEKLELDQSREDLVQRIEALQILIKAEEAKLKELESQLPQIAKEPSFEMPDQIRPRYT